MKRLLSALCLLLLLSMAGAVALEGRVLAQETPSNEERRIILPVVFKQAEPSAQIAGVPDASAATERRQIILPVILKRAESVSPAAPPTQTQGETSVPSLEERRINLPLILNRAQPTAPLRVEGGKLGIHVNWNTSPKIMEFIQRAQPAVVKAAGDLGFLAEVKEVSPNTVIVARVGEGDQNIYGNPRERAREFVAKNLSTYLNYPAVDYWEGWNEPVVGEHMAWYAGFEAERVRVMAGHGLKAAVGAFSTGVPEWREFAEFMPAIEAAARHGGIFTVHEYDAPRMDRLVGVAIPDRPAKPDRGALALRYRWWYEDYILPRGLYVPLVISEAGIDGGVIGEPRRGWRAYALDVEDYLAQLAWYDAEVQKDDYVLGFAVFAVGMIGDDWLSFDVTDMLPDLATYMIEQR